MPWRLLIACHEPTMVKGRAVLRLPKFCIFSGSAEPVQFPIES